MPQRTAGFFVVEALVVRGIGPTGRCVVSQKMEVGVLGATGITNEDFDFDPGSLVPDFVDPEDFSDEGLVKAESLARGPMPRYERAKEFLRQFSFHIAPGSLLAATETLICLPASDIVTGTLITPVSLSVLPIALSMPVRSLPMTCVEPLTTTCGV